MRNPAQWLTIILAGACAVLMVIGGLLFSGMGASVDPAPPRDRDPAMDGQDSVALGLFELAAIDQYDVVVDRPLFNEDRTPQEPDPIDDVATDIADGEVAPVALNVSLNGIIMTGDIKLALIQDNTTKETLRLREGMPMDGDMGAWVLSRIEPRKVVFEGGGDGPVEVELEVNTTAAKVSTPPPAAQPSRSGLSAANAVAQDRMANAGARQRQPQGQAEQAAQAEAPAEDSNDAEERAAKAEEIRRRVAERRAQLRAEAARRRAEQQDDNEQ